MSSKRHNYLGIGVLAALVMAFAMALWPVERAKAEGDGNLEVYVSADGSDEKGDGSKASPYASLAEAVTKASDGATIYVMSNLTATSSARFWGKNLTITSDGNTPRTISRSDEYFNSSQDGARGVYNGALIEVNGSLTVRNLILDDCGVHASSDPYYTQMSADGTGTTSITWTDKDGNGYSGTDLPSDIENTNIVQDAIISAYDGEGTIILDEGAVLKNYGGMSAVRITGAGSELIMKAGSQILDDPNESNIDRARATKQVENKKYYAGTGLAGAIWVQDGSVTLDSGSCVGGTNEHPMSGRALLIDGGTAELFGTISYVSGTSDMWHGDAGAIHVRNGGELHFGNDSSDVEPKPTVSHITGSAAIRVVGSKANPSKIKMGSNASISECGDTAETMGVSLVDSAKSYINGTISSNYGTALHINKVSDVPSDGSFDLYCVLGPKGKIDGNESQFGAVYYQTYGGTLDIYGQITNNRSSTSTTEYPSALWAANNQGGNKVINLYDGAVISGNSGPGPAVMVSMGDFNMHGGSIINNNNDNTSQYGGVYVRRDGRFTMYGGNIKSNGNDGSICSGITIELEPWGDGLGTYVDIRNGDISGNSGHQIALFQTNNRAFGNTSRYLTVEQPGLLEDSGVFLIADKFEIKPSVAKGTKLGNASSQCINEATGTFGSANLTNAVGSFWYQADSKVDFTITKSDNNSFNAEKTTYAAIIPTGVDGNPQVGAPIYLVSLTTENNTLKMANAPYVNANGYAVVLLQEGDTPANIITVSPADITVYMGGDSYEGTVNENGDIVSSYGLPAPGFTFNGLPEGTDPLSLTFADNNDRKWTVKYYQGINESSERKLYTLVPSGSGDGGAEQDPVRIQFANSSGGVVTDDKFELDDSLNQTLTMSIYSGNADAVTTTIGETVYSVASSPATLTVRGTSKPVYTELVGSIDEVPGDAKAAVVADDSTKFTINGGDVESKRENVRLLFDSIIDDGKHDRTAALINAVEKNHGSIEDGHYQAQYLDLVDMSNGNAWVAADQKITVYWGYPEDTDKSTDFKLYHFRDLHRDGASSGYDVNDISAATIETVKVQNTDKGIKFDVNSGGFSPFVLVWEKDSGGSVTPPATTHTITATAGEGGSISPSGEVSVRDGADQTFTITPDEGNKVRDVVVDGASVGALGSYTFDDVREDHAISVTFTRGNAPADPDDTGVSGWFETGDHDAFLHGYDDGTGRFGPEDNMTRGEAAQMFYNMLKDKSRGSVAFDFEDLPEGAWYHEAVATLASHGILLGTSPTTVEPERPITRAEFTAMAMRFSEGDLSGENIFTDVFEGDWYYGVVVGSIKYGWISGYDDGTGRFGPNDNITRAQATIIANRMLGRVPDGVYINARLGELTRFPDVSEGFYAFRDIVEATNSHDYSKDGGFEHWSRLR